MNALEIVENLKNKKGQHVAATWQRQAKTRKGSPIIGKRTQVFVRSGINFANLSAVKSGIESGERGEIQPIWKGKGQWKQFPFILFHVDTGVEYVRLYPAAFDNLKPSVEYTLDGKPATFEQVKPFLLESELPSDEKPDCFTVKAESIISIGD